MKYLFILAIAMEVILAASCGKDNNPCQTAKDGESYLVSDAAKAYIDQYQAANRIVFKKLTGEEFFFDVKLKDTIVAYQVGFPCQIDTSQSQTVKGTSQILEISLTNSAVLSEPLIINLFKFPKIPTQAAQEYLAISDGEYFSNSFETGDELFYFKINGNNPQLTFSDSLVIGGKTFYSVYALGNGTTPKIDIKYTMNQGVIYIKSHQNATEYVYERKE